MTAITDLMRTGRGLCASFDPAAGPERAAAFKADVERLFTAPLPAPVVPSTEFKSGDRVRITIDATVTGVRDDRHWSGLDFAYDSELLDPYEGDIYTGSPAVTVEHLPADPPPMERKPTPGRGDSISVLGFSARVYNCLMRDRIRTVGWLLAHTGLELTCIRNFGPSALDEVRRVLAAHGLELRS